LVGQQKCFTDVVRAQHFVNVVSNGEANQRDQKVARIDSAYADQRPSREEACYDEADEISVMKSSVLFLNKYAKTYSAIPKNRDPFDHFFRTTT
jgi:hypothetical protein